jgi:hypothetical protein
MAQGDIMLKKWVINVDKIFSVILRILLVIRRRLVERRPAFRRGKRSSGSSPICQGAKNNGGLPRHLRRPLIG